MAAHVAQSALKPVNTPLAIYGAVGTSAGFVKLIYDFLADYAALGGDVDVLALGIKHDLDLLQKFMQLIHSFPADKITESDIDILVELNTHLQPMMARCEARIKEVRRKASESSVQEVALHPTIASIKTMAADIREWTQRLHLRASILSEQFKMDVSSNLCSTDAGALWSFRLQQLQANIRSVRDSTLRQGSESLDVGDDSRLKIHKTLPGRKHQGTFDAREALIEYISFNTATPPEQARENVIELAMNLHLSEPTAIGLLKCMGFLKLGNSETFALILEVPQGKVLVSLVELLENHLTMTPTLRQRFRLARELVTSLLFVHSFGWVHESVRPSNVVISVTPGGDDCEEKLDRAYLTGFERCRPSLASSDQKRHDAAWKNNIYRSPKRIAEDDLQKVERHTMRHDTYSMGVVLLEIGIFEPLTAKESLFKGKTATEVARSLQTMASDVLPIVMGETYAEIVQWCLLADDDEEVRSLSYLHGVVSKLEAISAVV